MKKLTRALIALIFILFSLAVQHGCASGRTYTKEIRKVSRSIKKNPENARLYIKRALLYFKRREYDKVIANCTKAIELKANYAWAHAHRAHAYASRSEFDRAIDGYTKSLALNPDDAWAYAHRGNSHRGKRGFTQAIADFKKASKLDPQDHSILVNMGWMHYLKDDFQKCIEFSEKAVALQPADFDTTIARYNIALALLRMGQFEKANKFYIETKQFGDSQGFTIVQGAIEDLRNLISQNQNAAEARAVLKSVFDITSF